VRARIALGTALALWCSAAELRWGYRALATTAWFHLLRFVWYLTGRAEQDQIRARCVPIGRAHRRCDAAGVLCVG
jgi:hypothetical protein